MRLGVAPANHNRPQSRHLTTIPGQAAQARAANAKLASPGPSHVRPNIPVHLMSAVSKTFSASEEAAFLGGRLEGWPLARPSKPPSFETRAQACAPQDEGRI